MNNFSYVLFLKAGSKISWGSIDALYRAARERPDAAAIGAVLRDAAGRIVFPKRARKLTSLWHSLLPNYILSYENIVSVNGFFTDAILFRSDVLDAVSDHMSPYTENIFLEKINWLGESICVPAAQLLALSTHNDI